MGCVGSSFLREGSLQPRRAGATPHRGARASHRRGLSRCGAQAPDAQAQQLWLTGFVAPWDVGSSQTRARTRAPCIGRQTLNHCATREAPPWELLIPPNNFSSFRNVLPYYGLKHNLDLSRLQICIYKQSSTSREYMLMYLCYHLKRCQNRN